MSNKSPWADFIHEQFYSQLMRPHLRKFSRTDWRHMSGHPLLPVDIVRSHPEYAWDWSQMSRQPFVKIQDIVSLLPNKDWDWQYLSVHAPLSFIVAHPHFPWSIFTKTKEVLATNHCHFRMTLDDVMNGHHRPDMLRIAKFDSHHLQRYYMTPRQYHYLSGNPHHRLEILQKHMDKPWDWKELARNHAFPPDKMMPLRNQFPRWRWDHSLTHARLNWLSYHQVRRHVRIPNHFRFFIKNHFHLTVSLDVYFKIVVERFLRTWIRRRRMLHMASVLSILSHSMQRDILARTLRFM